MRDLMFIDLAYPILQLHPYLTQSWIGPDYINRVQAPSLIDGCACSYAQLIYNKV